MKPISNLMFALCVGLSSASIAVAGSVPTGAAVSAELSAGEVKKVDKDAKKITIKHGEIKNLNMPPMTMVFQVQDAAALERVKVGDKIGFVAEKTGGKLTVTKIEAAKQ